jgi:hypothetical protein
VVFAVGTFFTRGAAAEAEILAGRVADGPAAGAVVKVHDAAELLAARHLDAADRLRLNLGQG